MQLNTENKLESLVKHNILQEDKKNNKNLHFLIIVPSQPIVYGSGSLSNGPLVIGSYLESKGYSVKVLDNNSIYKSYNNDELLNMIDHENPVVVGLSVNMLNALNSYILAKKIKEKYPKLIVCAGGLHTFDEPDEVSKQNFDITFFGETEISMLKFMQLLDQQKKPVDSSLLKDVNFLMS